MIAPGQPRKGRKIGSARSDAPRGTTDSVRAEEQSQRIEFGLDPAPEHMDLSAHRHQGLGGASTKAGRDAFGRLSVSAACPSLSPAARSVSSLSITKQKNP